MKLILSEARSRPTVRVTQKMYSFPLPLLFTTSQCTNAIHITNDAPLIFLVLCKFIPLPPSISLADDVSRVLCTIFCFFSFNILCYRSFIIILSFRVRI